MCASFPFVCEGRMLDLIVLIPDHCLSVYFTDPLLVKGWTPFIKSAIRTPQRRIFFPEGSNRLNIESIKQNWDLQQIQDV